MVSAKMCLVAAGVLGALAVSIGAYHAHGLEQSLVRGQLMPDQVAQKMDQCDVAVRYQMYHTLALLGIGVLYRHGNRTGLSIAAWSFLLGVTMFSGPLYVIVFTALQPHWSIVPTGGVLFIVGWIALAAAGLARPEGNV